MGQRYLAHKVVAKINEITHFKGLAQHLYLINKNKTAQRGVIFYLPLPFKLIFKMLQTSECLPNPPPSIVKISFKEYFFNSVTYKSKKYIIQRSLTPLKLIKE